jgi:transcriptional regulator with XRE-family HTH domain
VLRDLLRRERERAGMTAKELSLRLRADPTYVSRVERGYRSIDVVEFLDFASALGRDPRELFCEFFDLNRGA